MNKKEIMEIRRRLNPERNNVTVIRGCYVDDKGEILSRFDLSPLTMPTEECERYFALFSKTLSGAADKNLITVDVDAAPSEADGDPEADQGSERDLLMALRDSALTDDESVDAFFELIVSHHQTEGNYLILLMHDAYDVPSYTADGQRAEDGADVFHYVICAICPVKQGKAALCYDGAESGFHAHQPDWAVGSPVLGLMYPTFDDRTANIHAALMYQKDARGEGNALTEAFFSAGGAPMRPDAQKETFVALLEDALGDECSLELVQDVHAHLSERIREQAADKTAEPLRVSRNELRNVLADSGVSEEGVEAFTEAYDEQLGLGTDLSPVNIIEPKQFSLRMPDVSIRVSPERADLIETRVIDGKKYLLIRAEEGVEVNGVNVIIG